MAGYLLNQKQNNLLPRRLNSKAFSGTSPPNHSNPEKFKKEVAFLTRFF